MQKRFKKLIGVLVLAFAMVFCAGLAACDFGSDPEKGTYSVTVTCDDAGFDFTTIKAKWTGSKTSSSEIALGTDGKASVSLEAGDYTVSLVGVPEGYSYSPKSVTKDAPSATIALIEVPADSKPVTVSFDLPEDFAFGSDVSLQIIVDEVQFGHLIPVSGSEVTVHVPIEGEYTIVLVNDSLQENEELLPAYCELDISYDTANDTATVTVSYKSYTYTVNVTAADAAALTGITVTIYKGQTAVAENLAIENGAATATLPAGNYTADLTGNFDNDLYYYSAPAGLTYTSRETSIRVKSYLQLGTEEQGARIDFDGSGPVIVKLKSNVVMGTQYALTLTSATDNSAGDFLDYFTSGVYTVNYKGQNYKYEAATFLPAWRNLDWNMALITFADDTKSFTINADLPSEATLLEVTMTLVELADEDLVPLIVDLELNETMEGEELAGNNDQYQYRFIAPTYGTFRVQLDGVTVDDVAVNYGEPITNGKMDQGKACFDFPGDMDIEYIIDVTNITQSSVTYSITIVLLPCGDFVLGEAKQLTLSGDNVTSNVEANKQLTFKAPVTGEYKIVVDGMVVDFYGAYQAVEVKDETGAISIMLDYPPSLDDIGETTFNAVKDQVFTIKFKKLIGTVVPEVNLTIVITLESVKEPILTTTDTVSTKLTTATGETPVNVKVDGLEVGKTYMFIVTGLAGLNDVKNGKITYNGANYSLEKSLSLDAVGYMNAQVAQFTAAAAGETTIQLYGEKTSGFIDITIYLREVYTLTADGDTATFDLPNQVRKIIVLDGLTAPVKNPDDTTTYTTYTLTLDNCTANWPFKLLYAGAGEKTLTDNGNGGKSFTFEYDGTYNVVEIWLDFEDGFDWNGAQFGLTTTSTSTR